MKKICLIIGSKEYQHKNLSNLPGCEADANNMFQALTDPLLGGYDKGNSCLLISPTLEKVRDTFDEIFQRNTEIDVFTVSFSGHGGVKTGNLFLCMKNTVTERLSTTAFPLSSLFTMLNEVAPKQTNIIIDACESGGVVFDLRNIINPELLGAKDTPGVSILASAASDQSAKEYPDGSGGYATRALVECLTGKIRVQSNRPYLNLVELGTFLSKVIPEAVDGQNPVVWGLNLFGDAFLTNNPHFEGEELSYSYHLAQIPASSETGIVIQKEARVLWDIYQNLDKKIEYRDLLDAILMPCEKLIKVDGLVSSFIRGVSQSIPSQASKQKDIFSEVQAYSCCIVALLPFINMNDDIENNILEMTKELLGVLHKSLDKACNELINDPFSILSESGGVSGLYFVPLRLSKLLGWAAASSYLGNKLQINQKNSEKLLARIATLIVDKFINSVVAISDSQSPYLLCSFYELKRTGNEELAEIVFGATFNDYIHNKGFIADTRMAHRKIPEFLLRRNSKITAGARDIYAQPDELLSVLLYAANSLNIIDVVNPFLEEIDHHSFNVFIPEGHEKFTEKSIENGNNITFQIGYEYGLGVFTISDFIESWEKVCSQILNDEAKKSSDAVNVGILLSSYLFPDRVPWLAFYDH